MKLDLCTEIQASFSSYLDGAVNGHEMQEIARHIEGYEDSFTGADVPPCVDCAREFATWRTTQNALAMLRPAKAPADLGLKLRLAISREQARRRSRLSDSLALAWENSVRPMMLQVSAGVASTVVLVGSILFMLGTVAPSPAVLADDEQIAAITAPHYLYSTNSPEAIVTGSDTAIVVEALVSGSGRVYDYKILSGPKDDAVRAQVEGQLLGSVFKPASVFGLPVRSHVIVTYAGISVQG